MQNKKTLPNKEKLYTRLFLTYVVAFPGTTPHFSGGLDGTQTNITFKQYGIAVAI
ncbi:hypothetical protein [Aestuariivivens sediminis]|uniref:hypothetical protein n=1 Tax=Aestuariivivens sediminis TaxID=2913557 RepID=UPI001F57296E|nr:hypothetical protein [Aestuariivivens sediminis]